MLLLEYVRGPRTCDVDIATAMEPEKKIKKLTCLVGDCNGFIASRIMGVSDSSDLMNEGMPQAINEAAEEWA